MTGGVILVAHLVFTLQVSGKGVARRAGGRQSGCLATPCPAAKALPVVGQFARRLQGFVGPLDVGLRRVGMDGADVERLERA